MTGPQLKRREELLARNDAVLDRWPQRTGRKFMSEMSEVATGEPMDPVLRNRV